MALPERIFRTSDQKRMRFGVADVVVLLVLTVVLYIGTQLALGTPQIIQGPKINLEPAALPYYALLSVGRMFAAYLLSLFFSLLYGNAAARSKAGERWLLPLLDILQSVPILSFLPLVLLSLTAILPQRVAVELAAIILIFTSQVWNITFSYYQALKTLPIELREAAAVFRLSRWLRFRGLELPFAMLGLIWNSVMAWAGGWFFLMAAEMFTVGDRDFRLPGLGSYLQTAANEGDTRAMVFGLATLIMVIIVLDQLLWRPLLAWAERFKVSQVESDRPATSWFLDSLQRSGIAYWFSRAVAAPLGGRINQRLNRPPRFIPGLEIAPAARRSWISMLLAVLFAGAVAYGLFQAARLLITLPANTWQALLAGSLATTLRVAVALTIALAWTIPVGVLIGTDARAAAVLQPLVQIAASIPATALFPVLLIGLLALPAGANLAAVLLMLLGTQWYLLFNVIAGASAIPQDLQYTSELMRLQGWKRWRTLILPSLFPYIITGLITAGGGAWNASIVAEYTHFGGQINQVTGLGALITASTAQGNYALLLAATLTMIVLVVAINRLVWRRLYRVAEERFRMDQ